MEHPIKMDDLGVPLFLETAIWWLVEPTHLKKYALLVKLDRIPFNTRVLGVKIPNKSLKPSPTVDGSEIQ